jgi:putative endonuclease
MSETERKQRGDWGETTAERYLRRKAGMRVLDRQWRYKNGELDLILRQGEVLVFVEVRVRSAEADPTATYFSIGRKKWQSLRRTAFAYLRQLNWRPAAVRFDVVGIRRCAKTRSVVDVHHWENVGKFGRRLRY